MSINNVVASRNTGVNTGFDAVASNENGGANGDGDLGDITYTGHRRAFLWQWATTSKSDRNGF